MGFSIALWRWFLVALSASLCLGDSVEWWQKGPIYQVYPASFADSNGDGWGDLNGILQHAQYFKDIGVGAVWLSPIYASPMKDNGYDVSNYTAVNPTYGTVADVKALIDKLHSLGIKFLLDFVPNHSSDQHEWFKKSIDRVPGYEDFYVWRNKRSSTDYKNGTVVPNPPNNWRSLFTPSAWTWNEKRQQFYLHQFGDFQPDLNFENPEVVKAMQETVRFWLRLGVDGLRVDATPYLIETNYDKDQPEFPGCVVRKPLDYYECQQHPYTRDQPKLYEIMDKFGEVLKEEEFKSGGTRYQFVEAYAAVNYTMMYYSDTTSPFNFNILGNLNINSNASVAKKAVDMWIDNMPKGRWPNWVAGNHDNARVATRFGDEMVDAINAMTTLLPGTPITYMGEELGMSNSYVPENLRQDKSDFNRDPERAPMQWNTSINAGFSINSKPYLPVNPNYWHINVATESATTSHLSKYKQFVELHQKIVDKGLEDFATYTVTNWVFGFTRPNHIVLINFNNMIESFTLSQLNLPNNKKIPKEVHVLISSLNSEYSDGTKIETTKAMQMRPRSTLVLSYTGASNAVKCSVSVLLLSLVVSYLKG